MSRSLSDDDSFMWEKVADEIMKDVTADNPQLLADFSSVKPGRQRVELLFTDGAIFRAIDSKVWSKYDAFSDGKDNVASAEFRSAGNEHFRRKRLDSATAAYTLAVFKAVSDSEAYALALANRSACLFETGELRECLEDVDSALATQKYPERLKGKILKRKLECLKRSSRNWPEVKRTFMEMKAASVKSDKSDLDAQLKQLERDWNRLSKENTANANCDSVIHNGSDLQKEKVFSSDISVRHSTGDLGRHVIADKNVDIGHTLIEEPAFAHILIPEHNLLYCQRCLKTKPNLIPCRVCSEVGYCGVDCRDKAMDEYHAKECRYMQLLSRIGIAHLSYRIVTQVGISTVLDTHHRAKERADDHTFGVSEKMSDYDSVYALLTHEESTTSTDAFLYILTVGLILKMLCDSDNRYRMAYATVTTGNKNFDFTDGPLTDLLTLGEVLLRHVLQLICNASAITAVVSDSSPGDSSTSSLTTTEEQVRIATAIFPRLSLLNHSCNPNVIVSYVGKTVTAKATRQIEMGQQVFNCYGPHFVRMGVRERREALWRQYHFQCDCDKCEAEGTQESQNLDEMNGNRKCQRQDKSRALKCPKCNGPMVIVSKDITFQCLDCHHCPGVQRTKELKQSLGQLLKKKDALREGSGKSYFPQSRPLKYALSQLISSVTDGWTDRASCVPTKTDIFAFDFALTL